MKTYVYLKVKKRTRHGTNIKRKERKKERKREREREGVRSKIRDCLQGSSTETSFRDFFKLSKLKIEK